MSRLAAAVLSLVVIGCAPPGSADRTSAPPATPTAAVRLDPSPVADPTPRPWTPLQLGEAYLVAASTYNKDVRHLLGVALYDVHLNTVKGWTRLCRKWSSITRTFIKGVQAIPFTGAFKADAAGLVKRNLEAVKRLDVCAKGTSMAVVEKAYNRALAARELAYEAAKRLRTALGLSSYNVLQ